MRRPGTLAGAGEGMDAAYYLIHLMGRGSSSDFAREEAEAAHAFAGMARSEGVGRVVYLGGLGENPSSQHLRSRERTAQILREEGPPLLGLITPVDTAVARPLVEGLTTTTVVTDPSGAALFGLDPVKFDEALRRAMAEDDA